jgi:transposase
MSVVTCFVAMTTKPPSTTAARGGRDFQALEQRRLRAGRRFARGASQAEIARELGVSHQTASRWYAAWRSGGLRALRAPARQGHPARLSTAQRKRIERALLQGAEAHGFDNDLWTLARVAVVIQRLTGQRYHPGHVWRLLRGMGWTPQRPTRRALERDENRIAQWVAEDWPRIKQTPTSRAVGWSLPTRPASA